MSGRPGDDALPLFATLPMRLGAALAVLIMLGVLAAELAPVVVPWISHLSGSTTAGQAADRQPPAPPGKVVSRAATRTG